MSSNQTQNDVSNNQTDDIAWMWEEDSSAGPAPEEKKGSHMGKPRTSTKKSSSNIVSNVLIVVGVALIIAAAVIFFHNQQNYEKIDRENEVVAEYATLSEDGNEPPSVDWASLKAINEDVCGWLQVPGTIINYPVYQSTDNEYYLEHAPDRSDSIGGSVFLDYQTSRPGMIDQQTIIYGHHMRNGSQFKPIADMDSQELFDGVGRIWYVTETGAYDLAPLFLYYTNADDLEVRQFAFETPDAFHDYLRRYYGKAVTKRADAETIVNNVQHVLTLSTCNYYDGLGRTLLVCCPRYEIPGTPEYDMYHNQQTYQPEAAAPVEGEGAPAEAEAVPAA
jgi:sortase B